MDVDDEDRNDGFVTAKVKRKANKNKNMLVDLDREAEQEVTSKKMIDSVKRTFFEVSDEKIEKMTKAYDKKIQAANMKNQNKFASMLELSPSISPSRLKPPDLQS